ncbi:MAG: DPP IV N-terminal domain-containing protein [Candidatus Poribacteria bacterium]|nr:DPP IV N-terminal domain-containing protein [Candidatus Poribacteria bacterium]
MRHCLVIAIGIAFAALLANAEEQILFESNRHANDEIYRHFPGVRTQRLTFDEGGDYYPALSPDGKKMAYVPRIGGILEIAVLDFRSGKRQQLTFSPLHKSNLHPTWSPDGSRIAYASDADGDFDIYIMDENGQNATNLTDDSPLHENSPHWSPVSEKIVFVSYPDGWVAEDVNLLDVRTGDRRRLTSSINPVAYPRWSPNGSQIAYFSTKPFEPPLSTSEIWRAKADGTDAEPLVTDGGGNRSPRYSPDGKWIAFESYRDFNTDIYALNLESREVIRLTTHLGDDSYPSWSPDGERFAFVSSRDGNPDIFTMTVNGQQITNLTKNGLSEYHPTWSPDGEKIAFTRWMGDDSSRIYIIDSNGENEVELAALPANNDFPAWSPLGNKIAFVNRPERGERKSLVYIVDPNGKNLQAIHKNQDKRIRQMAWSGDGTQIIFSPIRSPITAVNTVTLEVHTVDIPVHSPNSPDWSPDGQDITFTAFPPPIVSFDAGHGVFIIDQDGNAVRTIIVDTHPLDAEGLAWSPDGKAMLLGQHGGLYTLDLVSETVSLFLKFASNPNWQNPTQPRSVSPRNKLNTTWGDMKTGAGR